MKYFIDYNLNTNLINNFSAIETFDEFLRCCYCKVLFL